MNKLKEKFGFEFWQKFGKALMVVIAVMPAAGLMISLGKTVAMINPNVAPLVITGGFLEQIGWGVIVFYDVFELVCGFLVFCLIQKFVLIHMLADLQA